MPQKPPIRKVVPFLDARALLGWYDRNARALPWRTAPADRAEGVRPDPYRVWLSEIMLQQTTIPAVRDYFAGFLDRWPTIAVAPTDRDELANVNRRDDLARVRDGGASRRPYGRRAPRGPKREP